MDANIIHTPHTAFALGTVPDLQLVLHVYITVIETNVVRAY
jgi:hypothetical protein